MFRLIITGSDPVEGDGVPAKATHSLKPGKEYILGRLSTESGVDIKTPTRDTYISRRHAKLKVFPTYVDLECLSEDNNPFRFPDGTKAHQATLKAGETFNVGKTFFTLEPVDNSDDSVMTVSLEAVKNAVLSRPDTQLPAIYELSHRLGRAAGTDDEIDQSLQTILNGLEHVVVAAFVRRMDHSNGQIDYSVLGEKWKNNETSKTLVLHTVLIDEVATSRTREPGQLALELSEDEAGDLPERARVLCSMLPNLTGCQFDFLYVVIDFDDHLTGRGEEAIQNYVASSLKFIEIVANICAAQLIYIDERRASKVMAEFLPTPVISLIKSEGRSSRLAPRVSRIIFAFCDLRKCCKVFDGIEDPQEIRRRYQDLQRLLDILSSNLVAQGAIIEDLEGDAVKGLWGWPDELDAADLVEKCINAARLIMEGFDRYEPSVDARIDKLEFGMGIAGGDAVVGRLGSAGIFKISSQGHAPNLSQRLEELTKRKYFGQPILVNDFIHDLARPECCHRLARVRPRGMQTPVNVSRILPKRLDVTDRNLVQDYNAGLALFESGNFAEANRNLQRINHFRPASYLIETMAAHNFKVPDGWDGTLKLADKPS